MQPDNEKIDQAVLALLSLGMHEGNRVWKSFDWQVMGRLHAKGYISDPVGRPSRSHSPSRACGSRNDCCRFYLARRWTSRLVRHLRKRCRGPAN